MKVQELMISPAHTCRANAQLGDAARAMLEHACGCLPVLGLHGQVVGMVTDRDVCLAMAARPRNPMEIPVREVMSHHVYSCLPTDDVERALATMAEHGVRRLPVTDADGHVRGILSVDDVVRRSGVPEGPIPADAVIGALRTICAQHADHQLIAFA